MDKIEEYWKISDSEITVKKSIEDEYKGFQIIVLMKDGSGLNFDLYEYRLEKFDKLEEDFDLEDLEEYKASEKNESDIQLIEILNEKYSNIKAIYINPLD